MNQPNRPQKLGKVCIDLLNLLPRLSFPEGSSRSYKQSSGNVLTTTTSPSSGQACACGEEHPQFVIQKLSFYGRKWTGFFEKQANCFDKYIVLTIAVTSTWFDVKAWHQRVNTMKFFSAGMKVLVRVEGKCQLSLF